MRKDRPPDFSHDFEIQASSNSPTGKTFKNKLEPPETLIEQIVELATIARKDGMIALEGQEIANPFLAKAVAMLVDGADNLIPLSLLIRRYAIMCMAAVHASLVGADISLHNWFSP